MRMIRNNVLLLLIGLAYPLIVSGQTYVNVTQLCNDTGENFQLTYYNNCTEVCTQECDTAPSSSDTCKSLKTECGAAAATCESTGCECQPSSELPGDPYSSDNISENIIEQLQCTSTSIKIFVKKCALNAAGYKLGDLYMNGVNQSSVAAADAALASDDNNTCNGSFLFSRTRGMLYRFILKGNLSACNSDVQLSSDGKNITFSNAIQGLSGTLDSGAVISRQSSLLVSFSCTYAADINITASLGITPAPNTIEATAGDQVGQFSLDLGLWTDTYFGTSYVANQEVTVSDYIYVTVEAPASSGLYVQVLLAWATPSSSPSDAISYNLLQSGCDNQNEELDDGIVVTKNGELSDARFQFRVFQFIAVSSGSVQQIYVHAMVHLCDPTLEGDCYINCTRARRSMHENKLVKTATSLPITVVKKRATENLYPENQTESEPHRALRIVSHFSESWLLVLVAVCFLILFLVLLLVLCYIALRNVRNTSDKQALVKAEKQSKA